MLMTGTEMVGLPTGLTVTSPASQQGTSGAVNSPPVAVETSSQFTHVASMGLLTGLSPANNNGQQTLTVTLTGQDTNFTNGATQVSFTRSAQATTIAPQASAIVASLHNASTVPAPLQVTSVNVTSKTTAVATVNMNPSTAAGTYGVTVTTPASTGTETVTLNNVFTVTSTPVLGSVKTIDTGISKVTSPPAATSGTYIVTITGLQCIKAITGGGDDVYGAAAIRQYDRRSGQSTMSTNENTWVYGDTNGMIGQRKQAGTRGPMGGIGQGDFVPTGFIVGPRDTLQPQPNLFPLNVWQGTLTNGVDALVISPSLWISYGDNSMFFTWNQNEDSLTNSIFLDPKVQDEINTQTFANLYIGASQNVSGSAASTQAGDAAITVVETSIESAGLTFGIPIGVFTGGPNHDRPIGVGGANAADPTSTTVLPNATLVLTREMIEKRLGSNNWTTTSFDLRDNPFAFSSLPGADRPGEYVLFFQIERTSGGSSAPSGTTGGGGGASAPSGTTGGGGGASAPSGTN
jgi:hypothetical protein